MYEDLVKALRETDFSAVCPCEAERLCIDKDCVVVQAADAIEELAAQLAAARKVLAWLAEPQKGDEDNG